MRKKFNLKLNKKIYQKFYNQKKIKINKLSKMNKNYKIKLKNYNKFKKIIKNYLKIFLMKKNRRRKNYKIK